MFIVKHWGYNNILDDPAAAEQGKSGLTKRMSTGDARFRNDPWGNVFSDSDKNDDPAQLKCAEKHVP